MGDLSNHFSRKEFACRCGECDFDIVDAELVAVLEGVRKHFGSPVQITSGCRCVCHNKRCGGSENSEHLTGRAADFVVVGIPAQAVHAYLMETYRDKYGIGRYDTWTHLDVRKNRARW